MKKASDKKKDFNYYVDLIVDKTFNLLKDFAKAINTNKCDDVIKVILKIIFALIMVSLLRIPFDILKAFFSGIFNLLPSVYGDLFTNFFTVLVELIYVAVSIVLLSIFIKNISISNEVLALDKKKIVEPIVLVLKVFLILLLIPLVVLSIILLLVFALIIISTIFNVYLLGIYFIIIGLIIISSTSIKMIIKSLDRGDA